MCYTNSIASGKLIFTKNLSDEGKGIKEILQEMINISVIYRLRS